MLGSAVAFESARRGGGLQVRQILTSEALNATHKIVIECVRTMVLDGGEFTNLGDSRVRYSKIQRYKLALANVSTTPHLGR